MAGATGRDFHHDRPLSNFAVQAFAAGDQAGYIGGMIFPSPTVRHQSDRYYIIDPDSWLRISNSRRSAGSPANRVEWTVSSDAYFADNFALATEHPLEDFENQDAVIQLRQSDTEFLVDQLLRDREKRIANLVTSIDNVGSGATLSGNNRWSAVESADILGQISSGQAFIQSRTGFLANTLALDWNSFELMRRNTRLREFFKHVDGGLLNGDQLRSLFNIDRILVSRAIENTANEGASKSTSNVWGDNAVLMHVDPRAARSPRIPTFGVAFQWVPASLPTRMQVRRSTVNEAGSSHVEIIEAGYYQDEKVVAKDLAYAITDTQP